jgi:HD-GYP domain-containing protein (c-di-GMP phosphodiesterase class II)
MSEVMTPSNTGMAWVCYSQDHRRRLIATIESVLDTGPSLGVTPEDVPDHVDFPSYRQCQRLAAYTQVVLNGLPFFNQDQTNAISLGVALHDVGKVDISHKLWQKPSRLDRHEFAIARTHSQRGYQLIRDINRGVCDTVANTVLFHHERVDGLGYPDGLNGQDIPFPARVGSVIDVFDALTTTRPYKPAWGLAATIDYLTMQRWRRFDGLCVDVLVQRMPTVESIYDLFNVNNHH